MGVPMRGRARTAMVLMSSVVVGVAAGIAGALPARAAGTWSALVALPGACGTSALPAIAVNGLDQQVAAGYYTAPDNTMQVQVCSSPDGQSWSAPVGLGQGVAPAVAIAPDGRAIVVWEGGTPLAPLVVASVRPPGGAWSTPVTLSTAYGHPVVGVDSSGNALVAWAAFAGPVYTAHLPAGGSWSPVQMLSGRGNGANLSVNSSGGAVITWYAPTLGIQAVSGTVLGGFGAPSTFLPVYGHTLHPRVALNDNGWASLVWADGFTNEAVTRAPGGTWSPSVQLSSTSAGTASTAIDGAGNAIAVFAELQQTASGTVSPLYASWRPAGGTWSAPLPLTPANDSASGRVAADATGTFVVAYTDAATTTVNVYTVPALGAFGPATAVGPVGLGALAVADNHAVLLCGGRAAQETIG